MWPAPPCYRLPGNFQNVHLWKKFTLYHPKTISKVKTLFSKFARLFHESSWLDWIRVWVKIQIRVKVWVAFESSRKLGFNRIQPVFIPNSTRIRQTRPFLWGWVMTRILLELASFGKNSSQLNSIRLFFPTHFTQYNNGNSQYDSNQ